MEAITIPSPSVFLRASPDVSDPPAKTQDSTAERKRPISKRKKAANAASKATENASVTKPKQSKSRNGCITCKSKRLKCDEAKPSCQQCKRRNVECGGYKKDFKWRPFEETNVATNIAKRKKASPTPVPSTSRSGQIIAEECSRREAKVSSKSPIEDVLPSFAQQIFTPPEQSVAVDPALQDIRRSSVVDVEVKDSTTDLPPAEGNVTEDGSLDIPSVDRCPSGGSADDFDGSLPPPDFIEFDDTGEAEFDFMPDTFSLPTFLDDIGDDPEFDMDVEQIPRVPSTTPDYNAWALRLASRPLSVDDTAMKGQDSGISGPYTYLYQQPFFHESSSEMLSVRFDRLTCGILSVKDGPNENPWRTLLWPMAQESPALYHAVSAMTAFHSSRDVPALRLIGHEHKSASLQILATGINEGTMKHDTAIATTLALAFAECWDQHISSGNDHIKGARVMMNIALDRHRRMPLTGDSLARLKFLCNAWVYMDVLARITTVDEDESDDYDKLYCLYTNPSNSRHTGDSGFGIDFGMPIDACLDPLMGCASTLFPLIGRVANLVRRVCRSKSNTPPMVSQGMELKLLLETWDPPEFIEPPEDPTSNVQHSIQTAEAYRWATLLYLHQALPEIPGPSSAELASKVLVFLATVPLASRTVIVHIYPLMMAGCESTSEEERQWVKDRWAALSQRMRIGTIDKCVEVTKEVWRRRDEYESKPPPATRPLVSTADLRSSGIMRPEGGKRAESYDTSLNRGDGSFGWTNGRRRSRMDLDDIGHIEHPISYRRPRTTSNGGMNPMYTVKGRLHWVGVMMDWGWEVLLG